MTRETVEAITAWVAAHPYLREVGRLQQLAVSLWEQHPPAPSPADLVGNWEEIRAALIQGKPAVTAAAWQETFLRQAADLLAQMVAAFATAEVPERFREQCRCLQALLADRPELPHRLVQEALAGEVAALGELEKSGLDPGLATYFLWNTLPHLLQPLVAEVECWQEGGRWERAYCPVCGQLPALARLVRTGKGRERELVCGRCQARWHYKRMGCPYCESDDYLALRILEPQGVPDWRIDTCDHCRGYLKTYTGEDEEPVMLADWATLHFDALGESRGFRRFGFRLYQM